MLLYRLETPAGYILFIRQDDYSRYVRRGLNIPTVLRDGRYISDLPSEERPKLGWAGSIHPSNICEITECESISLEVSDEPRSVD